MIEALSVDSFDLHGGVNGLALERVGGFGSPTPRREAFPRTFRHGERDDTAYYTGRVLELSGRAHASSVAELHALLDDLKGAVYLNGADRVLRFTRQGLAYAERAIVRVATPLEYELAAERKFLRYAVAFAAADPRFYADVASSGAYAPSSSGEGVSFPLDFPLVFTGAAESTLTVANGGTFPTAPTFVISGPAVNPGIRHETSGAAILTSGLELLAGETLTIDVGARSVQLLDSTERLDLIDAAGTSWFELQPGDNVLRLSGSGFTSGQTELAVSWRDARI